MVLYPIAYALKSGVLASPGTWSRVAFVFLSLVLLACLRLLEEVGVPAVARDWVFVLVAAILAFQAPSTVSTWDRFSRHHDAELRFLLHPKDPEGVVVSTVPASWYVACAADIYGRPRESYTFIDRAGELCETQAPAWIWNGNALQPFEPTCQSSSGARTP